MHGANLPCRTALAVRPRHLWSTGLCYRTASAGAACMLLRLDVLGCAALRPRLMIKNTTNTKESDGTKTRYCESPSGAQRSQRSVSVRNPAILV